MPKLGSDDTRDDGDGDHAGCVSVDLASLEATVKNEGGHDGGQPKHEAEGGNLMGPEGDVDIRQHRSLKYRRA